MKNQEKQVATDRAWRISLGLELCGLREHQEKGMIKGLMNRPFSGAEGSIRLPGHQPSELDEGRERRRPKK